MQVETKNASLDTMVVTIKTLHVSGKQMTLAVFRQLPNSREREDSELWGVVRYAIKGEGDLWLVFSHDGTLRRRALDPRSPWADRSYLKKLVSDLERAEKLWVSISAHPASDWKTRSERELLSLRESVKVEQAAYDKEYSVDAELCATELRLAALTQLFIAV